MVASGASKYRVLRVLKSGGMAEVLEAQIIGAAGFERRIALKRLKPELAGDESLVRAFVDEARIAAQLHHAGIVAVLDFGVMDGDVAFQALELVEGIDLAALEDAVFAGPEGIPPSIALHIASEVAYALDYAHKAKNASGQMMRIVHRDVSPHNILISWTGDVKLADFGIASALEKSEKTRIGVIKGKPRYMAPEHARGDAVDHRADVFALGCVLHEMLAGTSPLDAEGAREELLTRGRVRLHPEIAEDIAAIIQEATRADVSKRYQSAAALAEACGRALSTRLKTSPRARMTEYLASHRPPEEPERKRNAMSIMLDLELVMPPEVDPLAPPEETLRFFKSIKTPPTAHGAVLDTLTLEPTTKPQRPPVREETPLPSTTPLLRSPVRVEQPKPFPWRIVLVVIAFVLGVVISSQLLPYFTQ